VTDDPLERQLVERFLARRDEEAFLALYRQHTPFLYRLLTRLSGGSTQAATEGVQETWVRAVERLGTFSWRSRLRTWLAGIAIHWFHEEARRDRDADVELSDESLVAATTARPIDRVDLERALRELPAGYRAALVLHDVEGFTHEEIASLLGVDAGTSKSQLSRARRSLRHMLQPGGKPA
jgi:RNA polymerase sigma-70 factor (ECF subfamily)